MLDFNQNEKQFLDLKWIICDIPFSHFHNLHVTHKMGQT